MELISLKTLPKEAKIELLRELGFDSDGSWVLDKEGNKMVDPYAAIPVRLDNCLILPGSTLILDDNPLSVAAYVEAHEDVLG